MSEPKFYINTTFEGFYPVGSSAVIRADNVKEATMLLNLKLMEIGLTGDVLEGDLTCISNATENGAIILTDGNY